MTAPAAARTNEDGSRSYPIPNPATGETPDLPNCSSVVDVLASFSLPLWKTKMTALGVAFRDDLAARVVAAHHLEAGPKRNGALREITEAAIDHAQTIEPGKGMVASDFGTAIHLLAEQIDQGVVDILSLPSTVANHAAGYLATIEGHGLEVVVSEATVYHHNVDVMGERYGYAATLDRIVRFGRVDATAACFDQWNLGDGSFVVDIKTGRIHDKTALQLASHVNAEGIYDAATGQHLPLPDDLRRDVAFALQLTKDGAKLIPFDLAGSKAWTAFGGALAVQHFGKQKPQGQPLIAASPLAPGPAQEGTPVPPAGVPSDHRAAGEGNPPPSPAAEPPSATEDRIPVADDGTEAPSSPGPSVAEAPQPNHTATEGAGSERVTVTPADPDPATSEPAHISDPLDQLGAQIEQRHAALLFTKHAHLVAERITPLLAVDGGEELLRRYWPTGVATLAPGNPHTLAELEQVAKACDIVDRELRQPFPAPDPTAPENLEATPEAIAAMVARLQALPHDLLADVMAANRNLKVPKLTGPGPIFEAHLAALDGPLSVCEEEAAPRLQKLAEVIAVADQAGVDEASLLAVVGRTDPLECTEADVQLLDDVTDACALGAVAFEDLDGFGHVSLVVGPAAFEGMKPSEILAAGRAAAKSLGRHAGPRSAADVTADPVLTAVAVLAVA